MRENGPEQTTCGEHDVTYCTPQPPHPRPALDSQLIAFVSWLTNMTNNTICLVFRPLFVSPKRKGEGRGGEEGREGDGDC